MPALLGWRYAITTAVLAMIARKRLKALPLRVAGAAFALGVVLYAADWRSSMPRSGAVGAARDARALRVPALVVGATAVLGRERLGIRRVAALSAVLVGVALVGGGAGARPPVGIVLALASASVYAACVLHSDRMLRGLDPVGSPRRSSPAPPQAFLVFGAARGELGAVGSRIGWRRSSSGRSSGTVFAVTAFLGGVRLVGPAPRHCS